MKRIPFEYAVLAISVGVAFAVATPTRAQTSAAIDSKRIESSAEKLARGKYLVTVAGCNDCHTPWVMGPKGPEPDMTRMLSGHPESDKLPPPPAPQVRGSCRLQPRTRRGPAPGASATPRT